MAKQILGPRTTIKWNGTDLSTWCTSIQLEDSADEIETTGFGETYKEYDGGLKDASAACDFVQDYAANGPDAVLATSYYAGTAGTLKINPDTSGTVVYTLVSKLYGYSPVNGGVGARNDISVTFRNNGTAGLTRGTA